MRSVFKISERLHYAFLLVAALAVLHDKDQWLTLTRVAERFRLSQGYLEEIVAVLRAGGIVQGQRGSGGGYKLARAPEKITLAEVIAATEGTTEALDCKGCFMHDSCLTEPIWGGLENLITEYFSKQTLADLVRVPQYQRFTELLLLNSL